MIDPTIVVIDQTDPAHDPYYVAENLTHAAKTLAEHLPDRYREAITDTTQIRGWVTDLVHRAQRSRTPCPAVTTGPSLLVLGPIGVGKTHQACGALRALAVSGAAFSWELLTAADVYARLRPRPRIDPEEEFHTIANTTLLILDDLGASKATEWTEEINYRLINHRYQWKKPTLITSNVPPPELGSVLGHRVASRLIEMATPVVLDGADRRRTIALVT